MAKFPFQKEIEEAVNKYGLDPLLVAAFCFIESKFDPEADRFEPKFKRKYIDLHPKYDKLPVQIRNWLATSMGLMQVMGVVAHEDGLPMECLLDLHRPAVGLSYGCLQLGQLAKRYKLSITQPGAAGLHQAGLQPGPNALTDVISAYNAGTARRGDKGGYPNQGYVDKVLRKYKSYLASRIS